MSMRQACRALSMSTSVYRYEAKLRPDDLYWQSMLIDIAEKRPTWGFWKMYDLVRLRELVVNHKKLHRIYCDTRLNIRRKRRKRLPERIKQPLVQPLVPNHHWSMDFMRDSLLQGKPFRTFNVIDDFNREALNITIAKSITSERVIATLEEVIQWRGKPDKIRVDNGPEFIADALRQWCTDPDRNIELVFIQKGKPSQNGYVERFNRTFREDVLDPYLFQSIEQTQEFANEWIWMYNNERPHESLAKLTPRTFLLKYGKLHNENIRLEFPTFQQDITNNTFIKPLLLDVPK